MLPPRSVCRRRRRYGLAGGDDIGARLEAAASGIEGQMAQMDVGKVEVGLAGGIEFQADRFTGEGLADMIVVAFMGQVAGNGHDLDLLIRRIDQRFVVLAQAPGAGMVKLGRRALVERLVGPLMVVGVLPALEAALLRR